MPRTGRLIETERLQRVFCSGAIACAIHYGPKEVSAFAEHAPAGAPPMRHQDKYVILIFRLALMWVVDELAEQVPYAPDMKAARMPLLQAYIANAGQGFRICFEGIAEPLRNVG